jgi:hypothetical protein
MLKMMLAALVAMLFVIGKAQTTTCSAGKYGVVGVPGGGSTVRQDCLDHFTSTASNGLYSVNPGSAGAFNVYCDFTTTGGPWTVFQRRTPSGSSTDFYRNWADYETGFWGSDNNHWLGLAKIRRLTQLGNAQMRIDMCQGASKSCGLFVTYNTFSIGSAASNYILQATGYTGSRVDGSNYITYDSLSYHNGRPFSTYDRDNDVWGSNCAVRFKGAWWYGACHHSNINGKYGLTSYADGPVWYHGVSAGSYWAYYNPLEWTQMAMKSTRTQPAPVTTCTPCPVGKYQNVDTFSGSACTDCEAGKFTATTQSASCNNCLAGNVQPGKYFFLFSFLKVGIFLLNRERQYGTIGLVLTGFTSFPFFLINHVYPQPLANQRVLFVMLENPKQMQHEQFATLVRVAGTKVLLAKPLAKHVRLVTINPALFQWHATSARRGSTPV